MIKRSAEIEVKSNIKTVANDLDSLDKKINELVASQSKLSKGGGDWNKIQQEIDSLNGSYSKQKTELDKLTGANKNLFKSTLDNGGAMGLLNDLTGGLAMTIKDGVEASDLFSGSMKGWKAALLASGIGILVVLLGTVIAYWDDIKGAVDGVSSSQKELLETTKKNVEAAESKLEILNNQDNILKQQGKSEREILSIKAKQTAEVIKNVELQLQQEKAQLKAQVAAAKRNQEILSGMLNWLNIPLRLVLMAIDGVGEALGLNFSLVDSLDAKTKSIRDKAAGLIFDPQKVQEEGEKTIAETENKLNSLKNQKAGFENSIKDIDNKAAADAAPKRKEAADKKAADTKKNDDAYLAEKQKLEDALQNVKDVSEQQKLDTQKKRDLEEINALQGKSEQEKQILRDLLDARYKILKDNLDKENKLKEDEKKKELNQLFEKYNEQDRLAENDSLNTYLKNVKDLEEQKRADIEKAIQLEASKEQIDAINNFYDVQKDKEKKDLILENTYQFLTATSELFREGSREQLAIQETQFQLEKILADGKIELHEAVSSSLAIAGKLAGEHTVAGKALAIAATTISTYQSAVDSYKGMVSAIPGPIGIAAGAVAAAASVATGMATVKKIISTKVPTKSGGGDGGGAPAAPTAPAKPSISFQNTQQTQIGDTVASATQTRSQEPLKAYVVNKEINNANELDRTITNGAKF